MFFILKSCIKSRLITEKLKKCPTWGKFDTFLNSIVVAGCSYSGIIIISCYVCESMRFLAKSEVGIAIFAVAVVECFILNHKCFYENTKAYLETANEVTIKKERKSSAIVVIGMGSVFLIAVLIAVIKFILD